MFFFDSFNKGGGVIMRKFTKKQRVRLLLFVLTFFLIGTAIGFNRGLFKFQADEVITPGESNIENLTDNRADYPNSQIPKYEKFELTFDINWYHGRAFSDPAEKYDPIADNTINPYWPYDANPAPNQYWKDPARVLEWSPETSYNPGTSRVTHNGKTYSCRKSITIWTEGSSYTDGTVVIYKNKAYKFSHQPDYWTTVKATADNAPDSAEGASQWIQQTDYNLAIEPGGEGNWQEYWLADPPDPIPAGKGITVTALFSNDNWQTSQSVAGFYYQNYLKKGSDNTEVIVPDGKPVWKVRFAPLVEGNWQYKLQILDATGQTEFIPSDNFFTVIPSQNHGFVRVSPTDPRYFELSDGTTLLAPGINDDFTRANKTSEVDMAMKRFSENGVKTIRYWMNYRGWQNPFGGGDVATKGGPQWDFSINMSNAGGAKTGDKYSGKLASGQTSYQDVYLELGVLYRFTGFLRTEGITGSGSAGVYASIGNNPKSQVLTGDNNWTQFSVDFTPAVSQSYRIYIYNTGSAGTGYFDDLSIKGSKDGGQTWSQEIMKKGDFDFQNYIEQYDSYYVDYIFQKAAESGIYLKTIVSEKQDTTLGSIGSDGTPITRNDNNFYSGPNSASRWLQQSWWRYMNARWGSYTSLHSWELCNEGDPFNGNYYNAINAFADYLHANSYKPTLASSSVWSGYPMSFWKTSSADYMDVHEYTGKYGSYGARVYAFTDGTLTIPYNSVNYSFDFDNQFAKSGQTSFKIISEDGAVLNDNNTVWAWGPGEYHIGINPEHTYTLRYWAKGDNIKNSGGQLAWTRPLATIAWSKAYHANDWISGTDLNAGLGTYDWQKFELNSIKPPAEANIANISFRSTRALAGEGSGTFWLDEVEFIDETTGQNLFVDGSFEGGRMDYDTALMGQKYSTFFGTLSDRLKKPIVWGETGITGDDAVGHQFSDYQMPLLSSDTDFLYLKKLIWPHLLPGNSNMFYWYHEDLDKNNGAGWAVYKPLQNFLADIKLSNGKYSDAKAVTSGVNLRAWGQKEIINGEGDKIHLWIDNAPYTWKSVVDAKAGNGTLPPPASGTVTIPAMKEGNYKIEWWNTTSGSIESTETKAVSSDGNLNLSVNNLVSDIAVKVYPLENTPPITTTIDKPTINTFKTQTFKSSIIISGTKGNNANKVLMNGSEIPLSGNTFSKEITLNIGKNTIIIKAADNGNNFSSDVTMEIIRLKPADANNDGAINIKDFSVMLANWGKTTETADFNEDGKVDLKDFSSLMANWGK